MENVCSDYARRRSQNLSFHPFDLTKVWSHKDYPLIEVGLIELNRNPENYFADVEQSAFNPANAVPGIGFSPDRMLQGRLFAYGDAHRYRLGVNADSIPVNRSHCPVHNYHRDGHMRVDGNAGASVNYEPNSFNGPVSDTKYNYPPLELENAPAIIPRTTISTPNREIYTACCRQTKKTA